MFYLPSSSASSFITKDETNQKLFFVEFHDKHADDYKMVLVFFT